MKLTLTAEELELLQAAINTHYCLAPDDKAEEIAALLKRIADARVRGDDAEVYVDHRPYAYMVDGTSIVCGPFDDLRALRDDMRDRGLSDDMVSVGRWPMERES